MGNKRMVILEVCLFVINVFCATAAAHGGGVPPPPPCPGPCRRRQANGTCVYICYCCDGKACYNPDTSGCCYEGTGKTCPYGQECCNGACCDHSQCEYCYYSYGPQYCGSICDPAQCEECDGHGHCKICGDDPYKTCCNGSCCNTLECKSCVDGSCQVCGGNTNKQCCNGTCCNKSCNNSTDCEKCKTGGGCQPCLHKASTYAELQACSRVDDPATEPHPNGCSVPYILSELTGLDPENPTGCADTSFSGACNAHDTCYQTCHIDSKASCDSDFLGEAGPEPPPTGMLGVCAGSSCAYRCSSLYATAYYNAVSDYGLPKWKEGQIGACTCNDCD